MNEEMHNLLGKYFSGHASDEEAQAVVEWKNSSPDNASEFDLLEKMWNGFEQEPVLTFNTEAAWIRVREKVEVQKPKARVVSFARIITIAAAAVGLTLGIWWFTQVYDPKSITFTASVDGENILLKDGSRVYLRKGATLLYPRNFSNESREVSLKGEAFFDITSDPSKPFIIEAGKADVQVLGTSFTLSSMNEEVKLVVKTGRVQLADRENKNNKMIVTAGERAFLKGGEITREENPDPNFNAWQTKSLAFTDTPLENFARSISDYFSVTITIKPEDSVHIAQKGVTIEFRDPSLEQVLKELEMITTYTIIKKGSDHFEIGIK